jgi:hypothetical protein
MGLRFRKRDSEQPAGDALSPELDAAISHLASIFVSDPSEPSEEDTKFRQAIEKQERRH